MEKCIMKRPISQLVRDSIDAVTRTDEGLVRLGELAEAYKLGEITREKYLNSIDDLFDSALVSVCQGWKRGVDDMAAAKEAKEEALVS
jgi:hypothetical protein